jgi:hypothetical protein
VKKKTVALLIARTKRNYAAIIKRAVVTGLAGMEETPKLRARFRKNYVASCRRRGIIPNPEVLTASRRNQSHV